VSEFPQDNIDYFVSAAGQDRNNLRDVLEKFPDIINATSSWGNTALIEAAYKGRRDCILFLLARGANIDGCDYNGRTPLMTAAFCGQVRVIDTLLVHGANKNLCNKSGKNARDLAEEVKQQECVEVLDGKPRVRKKLGFDKREARQTRLSMDILRTHKPKNPFNPRPR
jgi:ankyrin repeat protein